NAVHEAIRAGVAQARAAGAVDKPVLTCLMTEQGMGPSISLGKETIPCYAFPESPARVLSKVATYAEWRGQPLGTIAEFADVDLSTARSVCHQALAARGDGWLGAEETRSVLAAVQLPLLPGGVAKSAEEAMRLAQQVGYPVAVKLSSRTLVHKT